MNRVFAVFLRERKPGLTKFNQILFYNILKLYDIFYTAKMLQLGSKSS